MTETETSNQQSNNNQLESQTKDQSPVIKFSKTQPQLSKLIPLVAVIIIVSLGILSGLVLSSRNKSTVEKTTAASQEEVSQEVKESFTQTFRDEAEGVIQKNESLDKYAQGTHKLIRPGGESQTAYLTSSVLDLDQYIGKKAKVYGETFGSSQVGWLMDVGKVEEIQ